MFDPHFPPRSPDCAGLIPGAQPKPLNTHPGGPQPRCHHQSQHQNQPMLAVIGLPWPNHCVRVPPCPCAAISMCHRVCVPPYPCATMSVCHHICVLPYPCATVSVCHCVRVPPYPCGCWDTLIPVLGDAAPLAQLRSGATARCQRGQARGDLAPAASPAQHHPSAIPARLGLASPG